MQKLNSFSELKNIFPQENKKEDKKVTKPNTKKVRYFIDPRSGQLVKQLY